MAEQTLKSTCHCGAVELEIYLPNGVESIRRCDCSICRRRGAIVSSVLIDNLSVVKGSSDLTEYRFNTMTAKHYFCSVCGIYTHHQRRSTPTEYSFNTGCIEGFNVDDYGEIELLDGVTHPKDR